MLLVIQCVQWEHGNPNLPYNDNRNPLVYVLCRYLGDQLLHISTLSHFNYFIKRLGAGMSTSPIIGEGYSLIFCALMAHVCMSVILTKILAGPKVTKPMLLIDLQLEHSHYILHSTDPDKGFSGLSNEKKTHMPLSGKNLLNCTLPEEKKE